MFNDLREFLSQLADDGELARIPAEVDAVGEIAEITDRVCKSSVGGPALFFENVRGHTVPVVTNLLGSRSRMAKTLRVASCEEAGGRIAALLEPELPEGWIEALKRVPQLAQLANLPPKTVKTGLCQQVVRVGSDVDLGRLPIPRCWPQETAANITAGQVITRDAATGRRRIELTPLSVRDERSLWVHWTSQDAGWECFEEYRRRELPMPVAVVLGGDPVSTFLAATSWPIQTDPYLFAGFLRSQPVELVRCRTIDLEAPSAAEIVLEGQLEPQEESEPAGPLASPTGYYRSPGPAPVLRLTALTHRANPILPAVVSGRPPMEADSFAAAWERMLLPMLRLVVPELVDLHFPRSGAYRNLLLASIRKRQPQQARRVMHALWGIGPSTFAKLIVVVDDDVDVHDEGQVWYAVGCHVHPGRDVVYCEGPTHALDHAAPTAGVGHKMGLDATRKLPEEGHPRPWPDAVLMNAEVKQQVLSRWAEYGIDLPPGD